MSICKKVVITQEHINKGCSLCTHCPVALALKDAGLERPFVGTMSIQNQLATENVYYHYPKKIQWFVHNWDKHKKIKSTSFVLRRDDNVQKLIKI